MSFDEILAEKAAHCERVLCEMLPDADRLEGSDRFAEVVVRAMQYSVMAGGKRLRPLFLYETCKMYGGREELAAPFMAALEMIHNYSLVHDDMPAMDNDEYRRGRKTTWLVYGEGMAILTGDALLNYAYETALKAFDVCVNASETANCVSAMKLLARNAGVYGMVGGQCADLEAEKNHPCRSARERRGETWKDRGEHRDRVSDPGRYPRRDRGQRRTWKNDRER